MSSFLDRMFGRNRETPSALQAKERLQFVLVHDRINLPPERLKEMKEEILAVISKYVAVASDQVEIALEQRDRNHSKLIAEIPFSKSLDRPAPEIEEDKPVTEAPKSTPEVSPGGSVTAGEPPEKTD